MKRQECSVTEVMGLLQQYPSVTGTRREAWLSAPLRRRNAWERCFSMEKKMRGGKKEADAPFTPHIDICLLPRSHPDTINPAFHLYLALKCLCTIHTERSALSHVRLSWMPCVNWDTRQGWQQVFFFSSLQNLWGGFFLDTAHLFKKFLIFFFFSFVTVHLCCPRHVPERQTDMKAAREENSHPEKDRYRERYSTEKMQIARQHLEKVRKREMREECGGMSHSSGWHVSLNFKCWASDSRQELPLRVHSCFIHIILEKRAFYKNTALVQRTWTFLYIWKAIEFCKKVGLMSEAEGLWSLSNIFKDMFYSLGLDCWLAILMGVFHYFLTF